MRASCSSSPHPARQWQTLQELAGENPPDSRSTGEFPPGASEWPAGLSRRDFMKTVAASLAAAGLGGCGRDQPRLIVPRVAPEDAPQGAPVYFSTAMPVEGFARGIVVESHQGRPTKIEGNPDHPESNGAADAITQAAVLSLYDPDRSRAPANRGRPSTWHAFTEAWIAEREKIAADDGDGFAILMEPTSSPTLQRQIRALLDAWPRAAWYHHTPLGRHDINGTMPDFDPGRARVILALESDFLHRHPASLRYARGFSESRRIKDGSVDPSRLFIVEVSPSVTGSMADARLAASPARLPAIAEAFESMIRGNQAATGNLRLPERRFLERVLQEWTKAGHDVACIAGPEAGEAVQFRAAAINDAAESRCVRMLPAIRSDADGRSAGGITEFIAAVDAGQIRSLVILGANPAFSSSSAAGVADRLERLPFTAHLGDRVDETGSLCTWHLPESSFLETWSDLRGFDGSATILQPLIEPLYSTRSAVELLDLIERPPGRDGYTIVRETWTGLAGGAGGAFERRWSGWLSRGVVDAGATGNVPSVSDRLGSHRKAPAAPGFVTSKATQDGIGFAFRLDPHLLDGRWANNAWLQELPKPFTQIVWGNAALVSPALARRLSLGDGDVLHCEANGGAVEAAARIVPGHADGCVTLTLGNGRTCAGSVGNRRGYNAAPVRSAGQEWFAPGGRVRKAGVRTAVVSTQGHFRMEGREMVKVLSPGDAADAAGRRDETPPSLFPDWPRGHYAWAMSIDLGTCIGCQACVIACQAENNIPSVGPEQVARGREMHWIRVDRYYEGDPSDPRMLHQPVPCMHCEHAPCEVVCPVGATVHSSEGLNDMVYNRCIGTRYCSNNCPYKVRRFNFLDFRAPVDSPLHLQDNPDVTVRNRGVMEKCTYCVQRINAARIKAERERRDIRDGEIIPACAQTCPVEAIVFGNLNDRSSRVRRRCGEPSHYALLEELNTRPRTSYLARIVRHEEQDGKEASA